MQQISNLNRHGLSLVVLSHLKMHPPPRQPVLAAPLQLRQQLLVGDPSLAEWLADLASAHLLA
jgi:hypothetical protein